jgi:hypothetical protein
MGKHYDAALTLAPASQRAFATSHNKINCMQAIQMINILHDNSLDIRTIMIRINELSLYLHRGGRP